MKEKDLVDFIGDEWLNDLDATLPEALQRGIPEEHKPAVLLVKVVLGIRRWPNGEEQHFKAALSDSLAEVMRRGGDVLGEPVLPPANAQPLDALLYLRANHQWSEPFEDLSEPLWVALVRGTTRHLGLEYRLVVQINTKWGISPNAKATPRDLLLAFGFDPAEFSLYYAHSSELLPPDTTLNIKHGDRFEAQKDGRYGNVADVAQPARYHGIDSALDALRARGYTTRSFLENGQQYVEVSDLDVPSPPWSPAHARILIAVPSTYPIAGLDAFYVDRTINHQGGNIPYEQSQANISGRNWALISWHYPVNRPWNATRDDIVTHVFHCRGYFLRRGISQ